MRGKVYDWLCILFSSIYIRWKKYRITKKYHGQTKYWLEGEQFEIGDFTYGFPIVHTYASSAKLTIGRFTDIAEDVTILLGGNHHIDRVSTFSFYKFTDRFTKYAKGYTQQLRGDTKIGNDVWIGRNVFLLPGVKIGDGAIVGACSVVAKDIPPYSIAVGNPCKVIRYRFTELQIDALLRIKWWNWPEDKINDNVGDITDCDIDSFIKKHIKK